MSKLPEYVREGWRRNGPGLCRCPTCGAIVTTNALGRASHATMHVRAKREAAAAAALKEAPP